MLSSFDWELVGLATNKGDIIRFGSMWRLIKSDSIDSVEYEQPCDKTGCSCKTRDLLFCNSIKDRAMTPDEFATLAEPLSPPVKEQPKLRNDCVCPVCSRGCRKIEHKCWWCKAEL